MPYTFCCVLLAVYENFYMHTNTLTDTQRFTPFNDYQKVTPKKLSFLFLPTFVDSPDNSQYQEKAYS